MNYHCSNGNDHLVYSNYAGGAGLVGPNGGFGKESRGRGLWETYENN